MNILHVLSQFEVTGAEAYAAALVEEQAKQGHRVFVVSDTITLPMRATCINWPIGRRTYVQRLKNIRWLVKFVRDHAIQVIHAHSRAASWVSFFASLWTNVPFVSTVHGRQHVHASSKAFNIYGEHIVAVCESVKEHLASDLGLPAPTIQLIRNGVNLKLWSEGKLCATREQIFGVDRGTKVIVFVGRLSGPKGDVVRMLISKVFPLLRSQLPCALWVVGGQSIPEDIARLASQVNAQFAAGAIVLKGYQPNVPDYIKAADLVIGSGRVAADTLAAGKPLIAFGESNYLGLITESNVQEGLRTNFGDTGNPAQADEQQVAGDILKSLTHPEVQHRQPKLQQLIAQEFDVKTINSAVQRVYANAVLDMALPSPLPVLMYHRVVDAPEAGSTHGVWVTARQFERQLASLKRRSFTAITFQDIDACAKGERPLPIRPLILTFDDGYEDNFTTAFPLLQKHGFRAVIFVVTDAERRTNFWDPDQPPAKLLQPSQIHEMSSWGIEFGSHTITHPRLDTVSESAARHEIAHSKEELEQVVGRDIISFGYPYGKLNSAVKLLVSGAGYRFAVAADSGPYRLHQDLFEIRRIQVFPWTNGFGFWKKTQSWHSGYKKLLSHNAPSFKSSHPNSSYSA